ncbi:ATP-binding protein [Chloroflexota bacterium]
MNDADENNDGEYTAQDIQVLGAREAVRRRPGMYISSTDQNGLHSLLYEVVYNSIDEALAGHSDKVVVTIQKDNTVTVEDNGRGIPVDIHPTTKISFLETVMTLMHARLGRKIYPVSGGLQDFGVFVVNALSEWCRVDVKRNGKIYYQEYQQGIPKGPLEMAGEASDTGTTFSFLADKEIFDEIHFHFNTIARRMQEIAYLNKGVKIKLFDAASNRELKLHSGNGISDLVCHLSRNRTLLHPTPIYIFKQINSMIIEVAVQYNDSFNESVFSFANCINTVAGGPHLAGFRSALTRVLNDYAYKNKFLKDDDPNLVGDDIREGLTAIISIKLTEPQFEDQTRTKLSNLEARTAVESTVNEGLSLYLDQNPNYAMNILKKGISAAMARVTARTERDLNIRKSSL